MPWWGDVGLYLSIPDPGLGGAAVAAAGTPEQKERFLARFKGDKPTWGAMAITEPSAGSDSTAIQATARREGHHRGSRGDREHGPRTSEFGRVCRRSRHCRAYPPPGIPTFTAAVSPQP